MTAEKMMAQGPCVICGDRDYGLSCGGPTICPKCDCGHFDAATVEQQARVIASLRAEIENLRASAVGAGAREAVIRECEEAARGKVYEEIYNGADGHNWHRDSAYGKGRHDAAEAVASLQSEPVQPANDWKDDPSADERWNAGVDFVMKLLCDYLGVDPNAVTWDAATETVDGDVSAVIGNILRTKFGEDWGPNDAQPVQPAVEYAEQLRLLRKYRVQRGETIGQILARVDRALTLPSDPARRTTQQGGAREAVLVAVLRDCREYFLKHAKATWPHGKETPNEEMRMLYRIEQVTQDGGQS